MVVARQNGKTSCATIRTLGGMALWGENVIGAAQNRDIALEAWRDALEVALDAGLPVRETKRATGREEFWIGGPATRWCRRPGALAVGCMPTW